MGIRDLWEILSPVKEEVVVVNDNLPNQTWAVDLAGWVCEADGVKAMQGTVTNAYLRNLFFRVKTLTKRGIKLIFVLDGAIPEMKINTVYKRLGLQPPKGKAGTSRKRLNAKFKKCCELLDLLNIRWVKADGEAEAVCAALNFYGIVDACLSSDSDILLYGAKTVHRQFTCTQKKITYCSYDVKRIRKELGLERSHLISLGLLLGCDFCEQGIPGIGKVQAMKLMESWKGEDALEKMKQWKLKGARLRGDCQQIEVKICEKALKVQGFPSANIIEEFSRDRRPLIDRFRRQQPQPRPMSARHLWRSVRFLGDQLDWVDKYAIESIFPYFTDLMLRDNRARSCEGISLSRIVADRTRDKVPVYELEWRVDGGLPSLADDDTTDDASKSMTLLTTFECREEVKRNFSAVEEEFWVTKEAKKKRKPRKKKETTTKEKESVDDLIESLQNFDISSQDVQKQEKPASPTTSVFKPSVISSNPPSQEELTSTSIISLDHSISPSELDQAITCSENDTKLTDSVYIISDDEDLVISPNQQPYKELGDNMEASFDNSKDMFLTPHNKPLMEDLSPLASESPVFMSLADRLKGKVEPVTFPKLN